MLTYEASNCVKRSEFAAGYYVCHEIIEKQLKFFKKIKHEHFW